MTDALTLPKTLVADAVEAYDRYSYALEHDLLMQGGWHGRGDDGRELACGLGMLGPNVNGPGDCPAKVMPRWLARMVPTFFDGLTFEDAKDWGRRFYAELARLKGDVPFSVAYDWQAACVLEFWAGSLKKRRFDPETLATKVAAVERLQALHRKHLEGGAAPRDEWREALRAVYRSASASADAYASASADASADAYAYADASAYADGYAYAYAYAYADASAYAYASAYADAYADGAPPPTASAEERRAACEARRAANLKLLADGLVAALARVPTPAPAAAA